MQNPTLLLSSFGEERETESRVGTNNHHFESHLCFRRSPAQNPKISAFKGCDIFLTHFENLERHGVCFFFN
jgi:hypothetical protein